MPVINALSSDIISQIAAGEVIERPAYIVKELIENALDAGASQISVYLTDSGIKQIVVEDNGEGMHPQDLTVCTKINYTSKISSIEDLTQIQSLGFRGEALASIARLSQMTIKSRPKDAKLGAELVVTQVSQSPPKPIGMKVGTHVQVDNIFGPVPARKKFLQRPRTEYQHSIKIVQTYILAFPLVAFRLYHNGKQVMFAALQDSLIERAESVLKQHKQTWLELNYSSEYFAVSGIIIHPQYTGHHGHHYLIVNQRPVENQQLAQIIKRSYGSLIEPKQAVHFILQFDLPPEMVDVNVHPRKETVQFINDQFVYEFFSKAINTTFDSAQISFRPFQKQDSAYQPQGNAAPAQVADKASVYTLNALKQESQPWHPEVVHSTDTPDILQLHRLYLVRSTATGFQIIDQHAAHERILYEQFIHIFKRKRATSSQFALPDPLSIPLSLTDIEVLQEHSQVLHRVGFSYTRIGPDVISVRKVPQLLKDRDLAVLFTEIIYDLRLHQNISLVDKKSDQTIAYLACRSAIKAGDPLSQQARQNLLEKLATTKSEYTCPHGRPVTLDISLSELEKMFKRVG